MNPSFSSQDRASIPPVAIFLIATGKYIVFAKDWIASVSRFFLPSRNIRLFVLTNHRRESLDGSFWTEFGSDRVEIVWVHQDHLPWPEIALCRYDLILSLETRVSECSHLFYLDADMRMEQVIGEEVLVDGIVATLHPGFWNQPRETFTYETRTESAACVGPDEGTHYFASGLHGGNRERYLEAFRDLAERTEQDRAANIVAVWHDESHWNRYLVDSPPAATLHPGHCFPEGWSMPFPRVITALAKNHGEMRS